MALDEYLKHAKASCVTVHESSCSYKYMILCSCIDKAMAHMQLIQYSSM